jgi:hypothetical protein
MGASGTNVARIGCTGAINAASNLFQRSRQSSRGLVQRIPVLNSRLIERHSLQGKR